MDFGLVLPTMGEIAGRDAIDAATDLAAELGCSTVWATDHVMVPRGPESAEYGVILEPLTTLAYVAARAELRVGTSAVIVGMRQGTLLAKVFATLDVLSRGRAIAGIAIGDQPVEFANLERADLYRRRAAYLEETVRLWRHLWSGATTSFSGKFYSLEDYAFAPLPVQGARLPIWIGGSSEGAITRASRIADGYHATKASPEVIQRAIALLTEGSVGAGRALPTVSVRLRVGFGPPRADVPYMLAGSAREMAADLSRFTELGVAHVALVFESPTIAELKGTARRFQRDVLRPLQG